MLTLFCPPVHAATPASFTSPPLPTPLTLPLTHHRLNHYRNGRELCRKDLMAKNIKRRRRALEKEGRAEEALTYDFIPTSFVIPREYSMFVEEFKKNAGIWIMKPIGGAQGRGIFLFTRLSEISEWKTDYKALNKPPSTGKKDDDKVCADASALCIVYWQGWHIRRPGILTAPASTYHPRTWRHMSYSGTSSSPCASAARSSICVSGQEVRYASLQPGDLLLPPQSVPIS